MTDFAKVNCVLKPDRKLNSTEMLRAIKFAVSSEFEAIQIYQQIMESTDDKRIVNVLKESRKMKKNMSADCINCWNFYHRRIMKSIRKDTLKPSKILQMVNKR